MPSLAETAGPFLGLLAARPTASGVPHADVLALVGRTRVAGRGIWFDVHLIASVLLARLRLWTVDRRLVLAAHALDVAL